MMRYLTIDRNFQLIDESGTQLSGPMSRTVLENLKITPKGGFTTQLNNVEMIVEVFDKPILVSSVHGQIGGVWIATCSSGNQFEIKSSTMFRDFKGRLCGYTTPGIPFVVDKSAAIEMPVSSDPVQAEPTYPAASGSGQATESVDSHQFWDNKYSTSQADWNIDVTVPMLVDFASHLPQTPQRILVLGCGTGTDAAHFAQLGHITTAVDFSEMALNAGMAKFPNLNIRWEKHDIFDLPDRFKNQFDIIFEHTCFSAINPARRDEIVDVWHKCLRHNGVLAGIFFVMERWIAPPYGTTPWELEQRLSTNFEITTSRHIRNSIESRIGRELFLVAHRR